MTAESLKPFITLPPGPSYKKSPRSCNLITITYFIAFIIFFTSLLGFTIWNSIRTSQLEKEVHNLNKLVDNIQKRLGLDIIDDINEFEKAYSKDENGNELLDSFEEDDDEDDEFEGDDFDDNLEGSAQYQFDDESVYDELGIDKFYDEFGKLEDTYDDIVKTAEQDDYEDDEKQRKTRSISSISGVPVIGDSYAIRRNKSDPKTDEFISKLLLNNNEQALKFDWSENREYNQDRKPKKYLESRQQPESVVRISPLEYQRLHSHRTEHLVHQETVTTAPNTNLNTNYIQSRHSRVMNTNEDKSKAFKQFVTKDDLVKMQKHNIKIMPDGTPMYVQTARRRIRPMHKSMDGRTRQGMSRSRNIAIHFHGDTSRYTSGRHDHYEGNGRLKHPGGVYIDWAVDSSIDNLGMGRYFRMDNGIVTIRENGLYYVYAQIFYHDDHDTNGFIVERNLLPFVQCTLQSVTHTNSRVTKSNSCFTSGITVLKNGDTIRIADLGNHRYTILEPAKSFFGLIKIGDAKQVNHNANNGQGPDEEIASNRMPFGN